MVKPIPLKTIKAMCMIAIISLPFLDPNSIKNHSTKASPEPIPPGPRGIAFRINDTGAKKNNV